jgi:Ser/Thr protein kinase RdoA (MazF antagonist)
MERVRISDGRVQRPAVPWTPTVHALLHHLRAAGFPVPQPLGLDDTVETLSWLPGESGPAGWARVVPDSGLRAYARFLHRYHQATRGFTGDRWAFHDRAAGPGEVICHGDFGPWNVVWDGPEPVGLIDFDFAGPDDPLQDVAYALEYSAPFRSDETAMRWHAFGSPPDRRHRIAVFAEAYGLAGTEGLVDAVIERQLRDITRVRDLAARGIEPQREWVEQGYLDELAARVAWSRHHADAMR